MTDPLHPRYLQTPLPDDALTGFTPRRIPVRTVEQVPGADAADQGAWTRVNACYLEPLQVQRPCPPTRFRIVRTAQGLIVRVECHISPLATTDGEHLARDTVSVLAWPSPEGQRSPALYIEHTVTPLGLSETFCVANSGGSAERWTPELADGDRPRERITLRHSLDRVYAWIVDILLPWGAFHGLGDAPPAGGAVWRGNVVRIHPDLPAPRHAAWHATPTTDHHHLDAMGELVFPADAAPAEVKTVVAARNAKTAVLRRRPGSLNRRR